MNIIKIGEPITTGTGTKISKYIENGRLYKLIDFRHSTNRVAKEKGLVRTTVRYGNGNLPETCFDTFERKIEHGVKKTVTKPEITPQIPVKPAETPVPQVTKTPAPQAAKAEKTAAKRVTIDVKPLQNDKLFYDSYGDKNRAGVVYQSYDSFVRSVKKGLERYKEVLPRKLYDSINKQYGVKEKSITKIIEDNGVVPEEIPDIIEGTHRWSFKRFVKSTVNSENKLAEIKDSSPEVKTAIIYSNAWTRSGLRTDLGNEANKTSGNPWNILHTVWHKSIYPERTKHPTSKMIDSYLVQVYKNKRRCYNGENPIAKIEQGTDILGTKTQFLKRLYRMTEQLDQHDPVLRNPEYKALKKSTDIEGMTKSIENIEREYKETFFEQFWTDERKVRFSDALDEENRKFGEKVKISKGINKATGN